ncbi:hydrophobin [Trichoderma chlorosporum]
MKFLAVAAVLFASALAAPADGAPHALRRRQEAWCPKGLYGVPQCCDVDVLNVAAVDCRVPPLAPSNCKSFGSVCAAIGLQAKCCVLPVAGAALLCTDPLPPAF